METNHVDADQRAAAMVMELKSVVAVIIALFCHPVTKATMKRL